MDRPRAGRATDFHHTREATSNCPSHLCSSLFTSSPIGLCTSLHFKCQEIAPSSHFTAEPADSEEAAKKLYPTKEEKSFRNDKDRGKLSFGVYCWAPPLPGADKTIFFSVLNDFTGATCENNPACLFAVQRFGYLAWLRGCLMGRGLSRSPVLEPFPASVQALPLQGDCQYFRNIPHHLASSGL